MTQSTADLRFPKIESMQKQNSVRDLYEISRGRREEWGIDGYHVPKTIQYLQKPYHFPKEIRADSSTMALKRKDWPDPTTHSPTTKEEFQRHWLSKGGKMPKCPKKTIIDMIMKEQKKFPGPGDYFKEIPEKRSSAARDLR